MRVGAKRQRRLAATALAVFVSVAIVSTVAAFTSARRRAAVFTQTETDPLRCPTAPQLARRADVHPSRATVRERERVLDHYVLDPVPTGAAPAITLRQAIGIARREWHDDPGPRPTIALAVFTNLVATKEGGGLMFENRLAWVAIYSDAEVPGGSRAPPPPGSTLSPDPPCSIGTVMIPIDATSGTSMFIAFSAAAGHS